MDKQQPHRIQSSQNVDKICSTPSTPDDSQARCAAALAEITQVLSASLDVATSFTVIAQQAQRILVHDVLAILLPHSESDTPSTLGDGGAWVVAFCYPPKTESGLTLPLGDCSFGPTLLANQSVVVEDLAVGASQYAGDQLMLNSFGRAALLLPIQVASRLLGGIGLFSQTPHRFSAADASLVESIAGLLALALEHQRLDQQARDLAVAEERNRLAREIHDTLAHSLASIIINLESFKPYATGRSQSDADVLAETEGLARGALTEARRSVLALQPTPLQHHSLRDALTLELSGLAKRSGLVTQFYLHGAEQPLAPGVASALFRVAQEAFHNIEKHAAACHVILGLAFEVEAVVLTIEDDGVGFMPPTVALNDMRGFGLLSMAARTQGVGGVLQVTSYPGHGTTVRAMIPYARPAAAVLKSNRSAQPSPVVRPIRVLVVDNHPTTRQGVRRILDGRPDIQVVGEAADGLAAIEQTAQLCPDVVLLDLQMPRLSGIEALPRMRATHPSVEVVVLTMFDQDEQLFACIKAGARGYVLKDAAPETIVAAIRAANQGESSLPPTLTTHVVEHFRILALREVDHDALTERELEILGYMAKGLPYKLIASQLNVTTHTVQYHVTNILQKLHVGNRAEAVALAGQLGLLPPPK